MGIKRIHFTTWEEQSELDRQYSASLTPAQLYAQVLELNKRIYIEQLKKPFIKKITFNGKIS